VTTARSFRRGLVRSRTIGSIGAAQEGIGCTTFLT
jgi:hypothetical protein